MTESCWNETAGRETFQLKKGNLKGIKSSINTLQGAHLAIPQDRYDRHTQVLHMLFNIRTYGGGKLLQDAHGLQNLMEKRDL